MSADDTYEVFAIRYGHMGERTRVDNFIMTDRHDDPMPIDYYIWVIRNESRTFVVDTGFDHKEAAGRGRKLLRLPREGLEMLGVDAAEVQDVIISHMHYDHAGTLDDFPAATFHLQEKEMQYATGRHMCHAHMGQAYSPDHVTNLVHKVFEGRVAYHDGARDIAPGISVHLIGGHTMGVQCVRVKTTAAGSSWPRTPCIFMKTWKRPHPSSSPIRWVIWLTATTRCAAWRRATTTSFRGMTHW